jgi:hypothetical protein
MLSKLEKNAPRSSLGPAINSKQHQLELFSSSSSEDKLKETLLNDLRTLDPNHLTPLEALKKLIEWKSKIPS